MKIIISHDVDHLYSTEHWFRDIILEKLLVRSTLSLISGSISFNEWVGRFTQPFRRKMNHISELASFDKANGVPSMFFFGMSKTACLGMSYKPKKALPFIQELCDSGFECGVHGCDYREADRMLAEQQTFSHLTARESVGIRMHYVRFDSSTFDKLAQIGYQFDSTDFDKQMGVCIKDAYKVGQMIEFPVCLMDSYLPYALAEAKEKTIEALEEAEKKGLRYFTILFHDAYFANEYSQYMKWYMWLIKYVKENGNEFISFQNARKEIEGEHHG